MKKKLGSTDVYFTDISMGCWEIGGLEDPSWWMPAVKAHELVVSACENGIRSFDVADLYGNGRSEIILGQGIKSFPDAVVVTKVGQLIGLDGDTAYFFFDQVGDNKVSDFSSDYIKHACRQSLKRLQRDYIDVYLLHNPNLEDINEDSIGALNDLKKQGKVRATGVSSTNNDVLLKCAREKLVDALEIIHSVVYPLNQDLIYVCKQNDIGLIGRSPFLMPSMTKGGLFKNEKVIEHAKSLGLTLPEYAINHCIENNDISTIIIGMKSVSEVLDNIRIVKKRNRKMKIL